MFGEDLWRSGGTLSRLTRDLTAEARAGRLEPVRCRDDDIARVIDILLRHGKNNPVLVGPAGINPVEAIKALLDRLPGISVASSLTEQQQAILFELRLPRVVLGGLVGTMLALAGGDLSEAELASWIERRTRAS